MAPITQRLTLRSDYCVISSFGLLDSTYPKSYGIEPVAILYLQQLEDPIFQQDNARSNRTAVTTRFSHDSQVIVLRWPVRITNNSKDKKCKLIVEIDHLIRCMVNPGKEYGNRFQLKIFENICLIVVTF